MSAKTFGRMMLVLYLARRMATAANTFKWTVGLINSANKYLTAKQFQFKVNANGTSLRKKQYWYLEAVGDDKIAIKSCFNRYLASDKDGKITADSEEVSDDNKFAIETQEDGRIAIKTAHNRYFGGSGDNLNGFEQTVSPSTLWTIQLATMPQINLFNVYRKAYAHLDQTEIRVNEVIPWGFDATISIDYHDGKYSIRAANGQYLHSSGSLSNDLTKDSLYTLIFIGTQVAFRDNQGKYLAGVGADATLQSREGTIGKDVLFTFEDTNPQITLIAYNKKYVSTRQGIEVRANQLDREDTETFQLMAVDQTDKSGNVKWAICDKNLKYWNSESNLFAKSEDFSSPDCQFTIIWQGPMVLFKANNGKCLKVNSNGQLSAAGTEDENECKFVLEIINHPILTLRSPYGFIGAKGARNEMEAQKQRSRDARTAAKSGGAQRLELIAEQSAWLADHGIDPTEDTSKYDNNAETSGILECNCSQYDVFRLQSNAGTYKFQTAVGKYWKVEGDHIVNNSDSPSDFFIELRAHSHMCIVAPNGQYLKSAQNGDFKTNGGSAVSSATLWEY